MLELSLLMIIANQKTFNFSELMSYAKEGKVTELKIEGQKIIGTVQSDEGTKKYYDNWSR